MAEQIISPGVFTRENDLSFLPAGIGAIGAAIVGPTVKGPAFVPTVINSFSEYERRFGGLSSDTFVPQTVREYLKNAGTVTVCRVLAGGGYKLSPTSSPSFLIAGNVGVGSSGIQNGFIIQNYQPGKGVLLGTIFPSKNLVTPDLSTTKIISTYASGSNPPAIIDGSVISGSFKMILQGNNVSTTIISASMDPTRADYLPKQLGYNSNNSKDGTITYSGTPGYTYLNFKTIQTNALAASVAGVTGYSTLNSASILTTTIQKEESVYSGSIAPENYSFASTPMIQSGQLGVYPNKTTKSLFQFHTINHGTLCNMDYKISITGL